MDKFAPMALARLTFGACATPIQTAGTTAGALGGAVVGGPVGAVVGGATGAVVTAPWSPFGGPYYHHHHHHHHHRCRWYDFYGSPTIIGASVFAAAARFRGLLALVKAGYRVAIGGLALQNRGNRFDMIGFVESMN
jgi:hypothetical protein